MKTQKNASVSRAQQPHKLCRVWKSSALGKTSVCDVHALGNLYHLPLPHKACSFHPATLLIWEPNRVRGSFGHRYDPDPDIRH